LRWLDEKVAAMSENAGAPPSSIVPMIGAFMISRLIYLAAELGIADLIAGGLTTAEALADKTGTFAPALYRMLRALCAYGVLEERVPGEFGLGLMGEQLRSDVPGSVRNFARFFADQRAWKCFTEFEHTIRTGETGMRRAFGITGFEYLASHSAEATIFNAAMAEVTRHVALAATAAYDFTAFRVILDLGGGNGTFLAEILRSAPSAAGILFDVPAGLTEARETLLRADVAKRCTIVPGDFFQSVPQGADLIIVKSVIHDWNNERAAAILTQCRAAASRPSRLLLMERVMPERMTVSAANQRAAILDMRMLTIAGGLERTEDEYLTMLRAAGFAPTRTIMLPAPSDQAMIEAVPI
jgi:hypothetical protein